MELKHEWAVILAGGDGARLKSLTRKITGEERPKQFCPVMSDMSLVKETQIRVALEVAKEQTLFLVNRLHQPYYSNILSDIAASNLIEQPCNIGTAPAILYSVLKIAAADPQAFVAFFPSDHYVSDNTKFMTHIRRAFETARERPNLVIFTWGRTRKTGSGVRLDRTCVGDSSSGSGAVLQLRGCLWNSFVMIASVQALIDIIASAIPALYNAFVAAMPFFGTDEEPRWMKKLYALLGEINFSDRVLALVPERLTVLKVSGIRWRAEASYRIHPNGRRPTALDGKTLKAFGSQQDCMGCLALRG